MSILFEVNTSTLGQEEAHALVAFLHTLYPPADAAPVPVLPAAAAAPQAVSATVATPQDLTEKLMTLASVGATQEPAADAGGEWPRANAAGVLVDVEGLPWDARIHVESKATLKGGAWKLKRNLEEDMVAQVKNELRAAMSAPPAVPVAVPAPPVPVPAPAPGPVAIQVEGSVPPPPPTTQVAPAPQATGATFADLMSRVVDLTVGGIDPAAITAACAAVGLAQPRDANVRPDLIPALMAQLAALG